MRTLVPLGLGIVAATESLAFARNLFEADYLVAFWYLVAGIGFAVAAGNTQGEGRAKALAVALGIAAGARVARILTYGITELPGDVAGALILGALGLVMATGFAAARLQAPAASWPLVGMGVGLVLEAAHLAVFLALFGVNLPQTLVPMLQILGAGLAAAGLLRSAVPGHATGRAAPA